jgi:hypothetical protein
LLFIVPTEILTDIIDEVYRRGSSPVLGVGTNVRFIAYDCNINFDNL